MSSNIPNLPNGPSNLTYQLISKDKTIVPISNQSLTHLKVVSQMVNTFQYTQEQINQVGPIPVNTNDSTLCQIVEWANRHRLNPVPESTNGLEQVKVPAWDRGFLQRVDETCGLYNIACASNFLDMPMLQHYIAVLIAEKARGKSPEQLKKIFMIPGDTEDAAI
ncbi:hypothetical protein CAEBREN_06348 [Caenorhabditis brenneri]|uniref:Skp1-related protein n=1 Tax=Caenorhabditis brenneri TaxID=135651 RepID=G0N869_CAEBE|nr:hypothetical protein CAEBREN_06348 [Caenorhabditis brenneri]